MDRRSAVHNLVAAGAASLLPALINATPPPPEESTFRTEASLVLLDVSVKDERGKFVAGLNKDNFSVLENGKPQKISVFDAEDRPVTVGILVDQSSSMIPKRTHVLEAARALIEESNSLDEVFVLHFNDKLLPGLPAGLTFSSDRPQLIAALSRGIPEGMTALYDGLTAAIKHFSLGHRDKKSLVLISDGGDTVSQRTRQQALEVVERSAVTVYAIGLLDPQDPDSDPGFLRRLARTSGGDYFMPDSTAELLSVCQRIAKEIRTRYTVGYVPAPRDSAKFRRIEVRARGLRNEKLNVRTRSGYRSDDPQLSNWF